MNVQYIREYKKHTSFLEEICGIIEKMADPPRQLDCVGDSGPMLRNDRVLGGDWREGACVIAS